MKKGLFTRKYKRIKTKELINLLETNKDVLLLDVRGEDEYKEYSINNSINIPVYELFERLDEIEYYHNKCIIVYCSSGIRSKVASQILIENGFLYVYDLGLITYYKEP